MRPVYVQFVIGISGYFQKDLEAVRKSTRYDPSEDNVVPVTPGFSQVVQPGNIISVLIHLADGSVAVGECVDVIFSGATSRDRIFIPKEHLPILEGHIRPWLLDRNMSRFRDNCEQVDNWSTGGERLHTDIRYGLTQALLSATALSNRITIAEVVSMEWQTSIKSQPIDILASCHRNDLLQLDRMIMKWVAMLPHASFLHVNDVGTGGEKLTEYVSSVSQRVTKRGGPGYCPRLHFDVYGTLGEIFPNDKDLVSFLGRLSKAAQPYQLLIESPIIASTKKLQLERLANIRKLQRQRQCSVQIVADEWCNTLDDIRDFAEADAADYAQIKMPDLGGINNAIEAVLFCRMNNLGCCLGGSANETDISARITAQVALATQPDVLLSKPGIGADEGLMILTNEMIRTSALVKHRRAQTPAPKALL